MSWKKSVRNGNFSPHEEEKTAFCGFFVLFSCFSSTRFYGQNVGGSASQVSPEKKEAEDGRFPFAFVL